MKDLGEEGWTGDEHRPSVQGQVTVIDSDGPTWEGMAQAQGLGCSEVYALPASALHLTLFPASSPQG